MNKRFTYIILFCLLSLAGCDSVLDRVPKDTTNSATFFSNESEYRRYTTQFYTMLPAASDLYNEPSDLTVSNSLADVVLGTRTINSGEAYWQWEDLRHINYFLQHVDQCTEDTVSRNHYMGVALFSVPCSTTTKCVVSAMCHGTTNPSAAVTSPNCVIRARIARWSFKRH